MQTDEFTTRLRRDRLVAIVRGRDAEASMRTVLALAEEGIGLIEVSLNTVDALTVISRAANAVDPSIAIGAGTVVTADDARRAQEAGATWIVTPALGGGFEEAVARHLPVLAGALTPSEAVAVSTGGASAVKLFPASLGGPAYLRALRDPFPDLPFVPVGGVDAQAAAEYFAAGAVAVGVGSPLAGDAPHGGDLAALRKRAKDFLSVCRTEARS
ncbi:bifunctional 4-hydroxy-2-oxoglutarate aldolase/2-dehydro-3-deoxy-phosphogluconate aldolase [Streptomyces sp. NBC_00683]|uniref:bifunctional 4-hydroxy-2-oxoglutarate aldolase/2-dehydro-3-deoxy-phosphogluconate aldolase n=1 Tax=Streptomyces sp. NBC_00683 TaxID=2903670 RepID=UPI002E34108D|nr:bifunctional 4-hydroxy-2-oxoglutarate aldolase/2-dehydro-3-deoxy-phosphogluconate aldolase [Streptomyces sp. NBC_00683]